MSHKRFTIQQHKMSASAERDIFDAPVEVEREKVMTTMQVFPRTGEFYTHHQVEEGFELTDQFFDDVIENFHDRAIKSDIPVYVEHGGDQRPARGWIKDLVKKSGKGLWAVVELTQQGVQRIRDGEYRYISPEWFFEYMEPETGKVYENVLSAIALVNEPYFSENAPVVASQNNEQTIKLLSTKHMDLEKLRKKKASELTDDEMEFLKKNKSKLTKEEASKFFASKEGEESAEESGEEAGAEAEEDKKEEAAEGGEESGEEKAGEEGEESEEDDAEKEEGESEDKEDEEEGSEEAEEEDEDEEEEGEKMEAAKGKSVTASRYNKLVAERNDLAKKLSAAKAELTDYAVEKEVDSLEGLTPAARKSAKEYAKNIASKKERAKFYDVVTASAKKVKTDRASSAEGEGESEEAAKVTAAKKLAADKGISFGEAARELARKAEFEEESKK